MSEWFLFRLFEEKRLCETRKKCPAWGGPASGVADLSVIS